MPVVILLVAAVILGGIVVVAMGHGGELARDKVELPATADLRAWSDVARYRPPPALLGYHAASTEQALMIIARSIAERDAEISWLRSRLAELQPESAGRDRDVIDVAGADDPDDDSNGWARIDDDRPGADDDRPGADDGGAGADHDRASTAQSWGGGRDTESAALPESAVVRDGLPTPESGEDPSAWKGASTQDSASAAEKGPDPEGSQSTAVAEPPVQAGYWPQAGSATND